MIESYLYKNREKLFVNGYYGWNYVDKFVFIHKNIILERRHIQNFRTLVVTRWSERWFEVDRQSAPRLLRLGNVLCRLTQRLSGSPIGHTAFGSRRLGPVFWSNLSFLCVNKKKRKEIKWLCFVAFLRNTDFQNNKLSFINRHI